MVALSDRDGRTVEVYRYDVFGRTAVYDGAGRRRRAASAVGNPYFFTGRRLDEETRTAGFNGLYYFRARVYHPELGRFLQTDPLGYIDSMNLYQYGLNNPLYWSDPYGLSIWESIANGITAFENTGFAQYTNDVREFLIGEAEGVLDVGKGLVNSVMHPLDTLEGIGNAVMHPVDTAKGVYDAAAKKIGQFFGDDPRAAGRVTGQAAGSAALGAIGAKGLEKLGTLFKGRGGCFTEGTEILTPGGLIPIEDIEAGDIVWAWDVDAGQYVLGEVAQTFIREVDCLVILRVGDETIETTTEHPFWVVGSGWIEAKDLRPGHLLLAASGDYLPVDKVSLEYRPAIVYNFEVADAHDYFVSDNCVLVHNAPCPKWTYETKIRPSKGADGATAQHIIEYRNGVANSKTHQVFQNGQIIHQHQTHFGKYGTHRQFADEWTGVKTIGTK